jgi:hypothetical protein
MSWLFSQALGEAYLGDTSLDGEPSVPLSGSNTQQAYCAPDKMTKFSRLSRFGMTYKPLTESRGEELLTLYLADFHAKTSVQQDEVQELTENGQECGEKWHGLLARFDQDSHLWRTVQCSLLEDLNESLQTLPQWGMTVGGELYLRQTLVQNINENESGSEQKQMWLTPRVVEVDETPENFRRRMNSKRANDRKNGFGNLTMQVKAMEKWPTPTSHNSKKTNAPSESLRNTPTLASQAGGKLNPMWVEWLMGWPMGWTDLKPLEMDKCHYVQQQHGNY